MRILDEEYHFLGLDFSDGAVLSSIKNDYSNSAGILSRVYTTH